MMTSAIAFELTKVRTVRTSAWSFAAFAVIGIGLSALSSFMVMRRYDSAEAALADGLDGFSLGYSGIHLALIALVVFAVLTVTSEYSTGSIQSSLAAVPRRGVFYSAKILTVAAIATLLGSATVVISFLTTQALIGDAGLSLGDDQVLRSLGAGVLYVVLMSVFAAGIAAVLRSSALTIGILVPMLFMVSSILTVIPGIGKAAQFLPDQAGQQMLFRGPVPEGSVLDQATGLLVLLAWAVAAVLVGYRTVASRDV